MGAFSSAFSEDFDAGGGGGAQQGTATGAIAITGSASGKAVRKATATGAVALSGVASGKRKAKATATGAVAASGVATARLIRKATASGAISLAGTATGSFVAGTKQGSGLGSISLTATATGKACRKGTATGAIQLTGVTNGQGSLFAFDAPTRRERIDNRLGAYGISYPVGLVVLIDPDFNVRVQDIFHDPSDLAWARDGKGDYGKSIFRRGASYLVSRVEKDALVTAGLMEDPE